VTRSPVSSPSESGTPVAIITGSSHGSGELTAVTLARRGHRLRRDAGRRATQCAGGRVSARALAVADALALEPLELDVNVLGSVRLDSVRRRLATLPA
jgi:NAD(P)-dependent dehydrogenase (short-subunit alcohol dehydrogenase family)